MNKLIPNIKYIVIKGNETIDKNEVFKIDNRGYLINLTYGGWINPEDIKEALKNTEYKIDTKWLNKRKKELNEELKILKELI